jgi:hypothetical protein
MATTSYLEAQLPIANAMGKADESSRKTTVELLVSSYSGEHRIYLKVIEPDGQERPLILDRENAVALLDGLERAVSYLGYVK